MTFKQLTFLLSIISFSILVSCNIEPFQGDINNPDDANPIGVFRVDFDSETFIADQVTATVLNDVINISAIRGDNQELMTFTVFANSPGRYPIGVTVGAVEVNAAAYTTNSLGGESDTWIGATNFNDAQGEITITQIDTEKQTISGSFFFTGHHVSLEKKEFTNGIFTNVSYGTDVLPGSGENSFFAKIDGEEFVEDGVNGAFISLAGQTTISISATKNNLQTIGLTFPGDIVPGDYSFSGLGVPIAQYNRSLTDSNVGEGTFTITSHDTTNKRIVGTFQFTASPVITTGPEYEITEGSFDVTYF
ncbi:hypothetical protein MHTCC0001_31500 [Flavobacteriaceae bacterium MHTCC 0001]